MDIKLDQVPAKLAQAKRKMERLRKEADEAQKEINRMEGEITALRSRVSKICGFGIHTGEINTLARRITFLQAVEHDHEKLPVAFSQEKAHRKPHIVDRVTKKRIYIREIGTCNPCDAYEHNGNPSSKYNILGSIDIAKTFGTTELKPFIKSK